MDEAAFLTTSLSERRWRTVKYEDIYLHDYRNGVDLERGLSAYFQFYNTDRPHQDLDYRTPEHVHFEKSGTHGNTYKP